MSEIINCKNCSTVLNGNYCHNCGEKILDEKDFSIKSLLSQSFNAVTNIDSKLLITFALLFFKPGRLTKEFVLGRRKKYMQPFQVFVIANLLFFIFLTNSDIFRSPAKWYFQNPEIKKQVERISKNKTISEKEFAQIYDSESGSIAKSTVIINIPFIAFAFWLVNIRKKILFGKHLIAATHFFSFFLLFVVLLSFVSLIIPNPGTLYIQIPIFTTIIIYVIIMQKNFYLDNVFVSISKGVLNTVLIIMILFVYRDIISWLTMLILK